MVNYWDDEMRGRLGGWNQAESLLGAGKRVFSDDVAPAGLKLAQAKSFSTGVVLQRYQRAGRPSYGSFLNHNPPAVELERRRRFAEAEA